MAVKPITNRSIVAGGSVDRAAQRSFRNTEIGNRSERTNPGLNFGRGLSIGIKDIDTTVMSHIKNIMKPTVREAGEVVKCPVLYGNEERWKSVRANGVLRDNNNSVILPLMMIRRTGLSMNPDLPLSFDHDVRGEFISVIRGNKWSKKNYYDKFSVQTGAKPSMELIATGMPDFVVVSYNIMMFTAYMDQMADLIDLWVEHLETYFGDSTKYKLLSALEGDISDASEMDSAGERIIKNELSITIKGYMIPEFTDNLFGKSAEMSKILTPRKVSFGYEGNASDYQTKK